MDPQPPLRVFAIVPVGTLEGAKSRLGATLDAEERHDLASALTRRTVSAAVATPGVAETLVVTPDDEVRELALAAGARPLRQGQGGLNAGIDQAREEAVAAGAEAIVILPIDLPAITPDALADVIAELRDAPRVALVPDRHGRGTNVLALRPPDAIEPCFGGDSRQAHAAAALRAGVAYVELDGPLRLDVDTPDDLLLAERLIPELLAAR
jgi:2-phospho-L-lactate/phosphoenolpyruvate guanylyltransferase